MSQSKKAPVFIWPMLKDDDFTQIENQLVRAGYANPVKVRVGKAICWMVT